METINLTVDPYGGRLEIGRDERREDEITLFISANHMAEATLTAAEAKRLAAILIEMAAK